MQFASVLAFYIPHPFHRIWCHHHSNIWQLSVSAEWLPFLIHIFEVLGSDLTSILSGNFPGRLSLPHEVCDILEKTAHYHSPSPKLGASFVIRHLAGIGVKVVQFTQVDNGMKCDQLCSEWSPRKLIRRPIVYAKLAPFELRFLYCVSWDDR